MQRATIQRRLAVGFGGSSDTPYREVIIDGQRYYLIPVEEEITAPSAPPSPLTSREQEVVRLVAQGLVNKEIASFLRISTHTVTAHLRRIFTKLGVESRAAMVNQCATKRFVQ